MTAFDPRLLGIDVLDPETAFKLTGTPPGNLPPALAEHVRKKVKRFHAVSRSGWVCNVIERLVDASKVENLRFVFDTPEESKFVKIYPGIDPEEYAPSVWYTLIESESCAKIADSLTQLIGWCTSHAADAATITDCYPRENLRSAVARAHTFAWWTELTDEGDIDPHYLFCVLVTIRDLLNCAASRRWSVLYELEEAH